MAVFLVFSKPPDGVSAQEFNDWYDAHVKEIIALPGFVAAERFQLQFMKSSKGDVPPFEYCARFEIDGDFAPSWAALRAAVDGGHMSFPDWFRDFRGAGWECIPIGQRVVADAA